MGVGVQWLSEGIGGSGLVFGVVLARGISGEELVVRMGGKPGARARWMTDAEVSELGMEIYRPRGRGDGVVRVGEHNGWAFGVEYGDSTGSERLEEISRDGVEAIHYTPAMEHPPAIVFYARDGRRVCGFGLCEERIRWGTEPDLLLPELVAAKILNPDGDTYCDPEIDDYAARRRRALAVVERHFDVSLPENILVEAPLPAYVVMGNRHLISQED